MWQTCSLLCCTAGFFDPATALGYFVTLDCLAALASMTDEQRGFLMRASSKSCACRSAAADPSSWNSGGALTDDVYWGCYFVCMVARCARRAARSSWRCTRTINTGARVNCFGVWRWRALAVRLLLGYPRPLPSIQTLHKSTFFLDLDTGFRTWKRGAGLVMLDSGRGNIKWESGWELYANCIGLRTPAYTNTQSLCEYISQCAVPG